MATELAPAGQYSKLYHLQIKSLRASLASLRAFLPALQAFRREIIKQGAFQLEEEVESAV